MVHAVENSFGPIAIELVHDFASLDCVRGKIVQEGSCALLVTLTRDKKAPASNGEPQPTNSVWPGMIRLVFSGESPRGLELPRVECALLILPVSQLNIKLRALHDGPRPLTVGQVTALTKPCYEAEQLARLALRADRFHPKYARKVLNNITDALLACLLHAQEFGSDHSSKELEAEMFRRVCSFAEERLPDVLSLEEWASSVSMKPREFARRFRTTAGCSPYAWFMQRRIDRAKELLQSRQSNLCDVALSVGFYSQSHFSDAFRKREGLSPGRWQQKHPPR